MQHSPLEIRSFRALQEHDLDAVACIERSAYLFPWTRGMFRDCLRVGYLAQVMEIDQKIIGYGIVSIAAEEAHLLNICVKPDFQAKGHGHALFLLLRQASCLLGAKRMFLEVRVTNHQAIALYRKIGFNEIDQRKNYYPAIHGREDALVMALELDTSQGMIA